MAVGCKLFVVFGCGALAGIGYLCPKKQGARDPLLAGLVGQGVAETVHEADTLGCDFAGFWGAECLCYGEEFGLEVVERIGGFVQRAVAGHRVRRVEQGAAQLAGYSKAAGDADGTQSVEAVGVLEYLCFE